MTIKLTWYGHATMELDVNGTQLLVDPFFTGNPAASTTAYVAKAAGVACTDDGNSNTLDVCNAVGVCTHPLKGS